MVGKEQRYTIEGDMRSDFELQKLSEWWFDLSKIALGSMAIKSFGSLAAGLFLGLLFARVGQKFARMVG